MGMLTGVISEHWYFQNYWRPLTLFGVAVPSIEDALFGAGVTAFGLTIGWVILKKKAPVRQPGIVKRLALVVEFAVLMNIVLVDILHAESIVVSCVVFVVIGAFGLIRYPQGWKSVLVTIASLLVLMSVVYAILFLWLDPHYISTYFLIGNYTWAPVVGGFLPVTEILWYTAWGFCAPTLFDLVNGRSRTFQATA